MILIICYFWLNVNNFVMLRSNFFVLRNCETLFSSDVVAHLTLRESAEYVIAEFAAIPKCPTVI